MAVHMEISRILIRESDDWHVVELREVDGDRTFQIVIGIHEAAAIERRILGQVPARPQTHELMATIIEKLGYRVTRVIVNDLQHDEFGRGTFYARLVLQNGGHEIDVDSRPSDALALGVATNVPIYVEQHVLDEATRQA
jgi:bifunctional DNase/RNase